MDFEALPQECLTKIISSTTPTDACILSSVSKPIKLIADSDEVWQSFLPPFLSNTIRSGSNVYPSKKELYFTLCHHPILIEDGEKRSQLEELEEKSGKNCYMLAPNDLVIIWIDSQLCLRRIYSPNFMHLFENRSQEVAEVLEVWSLEIRGTINTQMLSGKTLYAAYFVFKAASNSYGFENQVLEVAFGTVREKSNKRTIFLYRYDTNGTRRDVSRHMTRRDIPRHGPRPDTSRCGPQRDISRRGIFHRLAISYPPRETIPDLKERGDGWLEVEVGDFYNEGDLDEELEVIITVTKNVDGTGGIISQGIEIRPKTVNN